MGSFGREGWDPHWADQPRLPVLLVLRGQRDAGVHGGQQRGVLLGGRPDRAVPQHARRAERAARQAQALARVRRRGVQPERQEHHPLHRVLLRERPLHAHPLLLRRHRHRHRPHLADRALPGDHGPPRRRPVAPVGVQQRDRGVRRDLRHLHLRDAQGGGTRGSGLPACFSLLHVHFILEQSKVSTFLKKKTKNKTKKRTKKNKNKNKNCYFLLVNKF